MLVKWKKLNNKNKAKIITLAVLAFAVLTLAGLFWRVSATEAAVNKYLNYQGKLLDSSKITVSDATYRIDFRIYDQDAPGGSVLWSDSFDVDVEDGLFSVLLGSSGTLDLDFEANDGYWLSIEVEGDGEMTPRKEIGAAAYAFNSDLLDGLNTTQTGSTTAAVAAYNSNGNLYIRGNPQGGAYTQGSLYIEPYNAAGANETLLGIGSGGASKLLLDAEGDLTLGGYASMTDLYVEAGSGAYINIEGSGSRTTSGAYLVGVNSVNISQSISSNVQFVLEDMSSAISDAGISRWTLAAAGYLYPTSTTADVYIASPGNYLGIGTTSPDSQLHLDGPGATTLTMEKDGNQSAVFDWQSGGTSYASLTWDSAEDFIWDNKQGNFVFKDSDGGDGKVGINTDSPTSTLQVSGGDVHFQGTGGSPGLYWDESGNRLGINTTAPNRTLTVVDPATSNRLAFTQDYSVTFDFLTADSATLVVETPQNTEGSGIVFRSASRDWFAGIDAGTGEHYFISREGVYNLSIDTSGNVGIGTSTSDGLLTLTDDDDIPEIYFTSSTYDNTPGFRLSNTSGKLEYRDEDEAAWTPFDDFAAAGDILWTDSGAYIYATPVGDYDSTGMRIYDNGEINTDSNLVVDGLSGFNAATHTSRVLNVATSTLNNFGIYSSYSGMETLTPGDWASPTNGAAGMFMANGATPGYANTAVGAEATGATTINRGVVARAYNGLGLNSAFYGIASGTESYINWGKNYSYENDADAWGAYYEVNTTANGHSADHRGVETAVGGGDKNSGFKTTVTAPAGEEGYGIDASVSATNTNELFGGDFSVNDSGSGDVYGIRVNANSGTGTAWAAYFQQGDVYSANNLMVGADTGETLSNDAFSLDGDDLFVYGMAGIEGNVYTDGQFIASSTTAFGETAIYGGFASTSASYFSILSNNDADDYFRFLSQDNQASQHFVSAGLANHPGFRLNSTTNELEYRDSGASVWTPFNNFLSSGATIWEDRGSYIEPNEASGNFKIAELTGHTAIGSDATTSADWVLGLGKTYSGAATSGIDGGVSSTVRFTGATNGDYYLIGSGTDVRWNGTPSAGSSELALGFVGQVIVEGTGGGTVDEVRAGMGLTEVQGGTVDNNIGIFARSKENGGTINAGYGVKASSVDATSNYGVYAEASGGTANYAFYSPDGGGYSYFGDRVAIQEAAISSSSTVGIMETFSGAGLSGKIGGVSTTAIFTGTSAGNLYFGTNGFKSIWSGTASAAGSDMLLGTTNQAFVSDTGGNTLGQVRGTFTQVQIQGGDVSTSYAIYGDNDIQGGNVSTSYAIYGDNDASGGLVDDTYGGWFRGRDGANENFGVKAVARDGVVQYGGWFEGDGGAGDTTYGVASYADSGDTNLAGYFESSGTNVRNYGLYAYAHDAATTNYGVLAHATGGDTNYGVRAYATGGDTNYAFYSLDGGGYSYFGDHVAIEDASTTNDFVALGVMESFTTNYGAVTMDYSGVSSTAIWSGGANSGLVSIKGGNNIAIWNGAAGGSGLDQVFGTYSKAQKIGGGTPHIIAGSYGHGHLDTGTANITAGVYAKGESDAGTTATYGVYGAYAESTAQSGQTAFGVYSTATGGDTNYAFYSPDAGGYSYFGDHVAIEDASPTSTAAINIQESYTNSGATVSNVSSTVMANGTPSEVRGLYGHIYGDSGTQSLARAVYGYVDEGSGAIANGTGGYFRSDDATTNYGVKARTSGPAASTNYGVYAYAQSASGNTSYGVFGKAAGSTTNYSGYFSDGYVHIEGDDTPVTPDYAHTDGSLYVNQRFEAEAGGRFDTYGISLNLDGGTEIPSLNYEIVMTRDDSVINVYGTNDKTLRVFNSSASYITNLDVEGHMAIGEMANPSERTLNFIYERFDENINTVEKIQYRGTYNYMPLSVSNTGTSVQTVGVATDNHITQSGSDNGLANIIGVRNNVINYGSDDETNYLYGEYSTVKTSGSGVADSLKGNFILVQNDSTDPLNSMHGIYAEVTGGTAATSYYYGGEIVVKTVDSISDDIYLVRSDYKNGSTTGNIYGYYFDSVDTDGNVWALYNDQDDVDAKIGGDMYIGDGSTGDDDYIYFDGGTQSLRYDEGDDRFIFNNGLVTANSLFAGNDLYLNYDGGDSNASIYFYEGGSWTGAEIRWADVATRFYFTEELRLSFDATQSTNGVCKDSTGIADGDIMDCSGTPSDIAEWYPIIAGTSAGDIVYASSGTVAFTEELFDPETGLSTSSTASYTVSYVDRSATPYDSRIIGIVSTSPVQRFGEAVKDATSSTDVIALIGRVPAKVSNANGSIKAGDLITSSDTKGVGMKATKPGMVVGTALEDMSGATDTILVFVNPMWYSGGAIHNDGSQSTLEDNFAFEPTGSASSSTPEIDSYGLTFRGAAWDAASSTELILGMTMKNEVSSTDEFGLSFENNDGNKVAFISNNGDLMLGNKLYPSDRGTMQDDYYIFLNSAGPGGKPYMMTNAAGWSTGSYDFAEMFPSDQLLQAGEIVTVGSADESVVRSASAYQTSIAGIVSTEPGFIAGDFTTSTYPIALAGRVPTRVTNANGSISIGDPITTSDIPGVGMKATSAGPIVGYALEASNDTSDEIIVYVNPGWYGGGATSALPGTTGDTSGFDPATSGDVTYLSGALDMQGNDIYGVNRIYGNGYKWEIDENGVAVSQVATAGGDKPVYGITANKAEIIVSGSGTTENGKATIEFTDAVANMFDSANLNIKVIVTPTSADTPGLAVTNKSSAGFTVEELNSGDGNVSFDWIFMAPRVGYEIELDDYTVNSSEATDSSSTDPIISDSDSSSTDPIISDSDSSSTDPIISDSGSSGTDSVSP